MHFHPKSGRARHDLHHIGRYCPSVDPVLSGEPLYQPRGTNGWSNDSENDGIYCESL